MTELSSGWTICARKGKGGPNVEQLLVLTLEEQGKKAEARSRLKSARIEFPRSADLAGVDAALHAKDGKPEEADRILAQFLSGDPDNTKLAMMRAQLQAESLKNPDQARALLKAWRIGSKTPSPWCSSRPSRWSRTDSTRLRQ